MREVDSYAEEPWRRWVREELSLIHFSLVLVLILIVVVIVVTTRRIDRLDDRLRQTTTTTIGRA